MEGFDQMKITIETIPHNQQRYDTCGDWQFNAQGDLHIKISDLGDWKAESLVAVHELVEVLLAKDRGITEQAVDEFDFAYEKARQPGDESEPGDDPNCPVYKEHQIATIIERLLCHEFDINWQQYDKAIGEL